MLGVAVSVLWPLSVARKILVRDKQMVPSVPSHADLHSRIQENLRETQDQLQTCGFFTLLGHYKTNIPYFHAKVHLKAD